ncbi:UbiX family flavin prenyltransferase [Sneathiella chinensis]|uniref:Flavin prenyltransferase UbiX n=1 Tax=Sneathiella chinensis TaxID=349750 RepID=A0ABQ5U3P3_9PROT|nr:UbiX family flavin prenyltransferase [Sneathiella chinensis]GLQ06524.1 flavin prenyltransferase UbiX [Sneathiella chinensis]
MNTHNLIVGISGASGALYGIRLLEACRDLGVQTHLVISKAGEMTLHHETGLAVSDVRALATKSYKIADIGAAIASGSFRNAGMVIAPCSIRSMSEIATGVTSNLMTRAADVALKERRRLVLMVRESPLHSGHLATMKTLSDLGAIIAPPVPAFYTHPTSLDDMVNHTVGRTLDLLAIENNLAERWDGLKNARTRSQENDGGRD